MVAMPDPSTFARAALAARGAGRRAHVLRRADARAHARTRATRATCCAARCSAPRAMGFDTLQRRPRARVLPLPRQQEHRGRSTRAATSTSRRSTPAPTCAARPSSRSSSSASTSSTPTTRSARASTRSTCATREALKMADDCHDVPHHGQGVRDEVRLARDVHAEAAVRRERVRACTPTCRCSRTGTNAFFDADDPYFLSDVAQGVHRRPAAPRARAVARSSPSGSTPTSASCPATRRRCTSPGAGATARRSCACRSTTPATSRPRAWSCAARTPPATRT